MNHAGGLSRKRMVLGALLVAVVGVLSIVPWRVVAQEVTKLDRVTIELDKPEIHAGLSSKLIDALQLNERQVSRLKMIHEAALREVFRALTPNQRMQLKMLVAHAQEKTFVNMTEEQKLKLDRMKVEMGTAFKNIEGDSTLTREQKEQRLRALKLSHEQAFHRILTPGQLDGIKTVPDNENTKLDLSDLQTQQMKALHEELMARAAQVEADPRLTPEQKEDRLKEIKISGAERMHEILGPGLATIVLDHHSQDELGPYSLASLHKLSDLTPAQKQRIEAIHANAQKQFIGTLTLAQRAKLKQIHGGQ